MNLYKSFYKDLTNIDFISFIWTYNKIKNRNGFQSIKSNPFYLYLIKLQKQTIYNYKTKFIIIIILLLHQNQCQPTMYVFLYNAKRKQISSLDLDFQLHEFPKKIQLHLDFHVKLA